MKRFCIFLLILMLLVSAGGCGPRQSAEDGGGLKIAASIFPAYDFARQICGDNVEVTLLIPPGNEVHGYEPSLKDIAVLKDCDLFLYAGGDSDVWTKDIIAASGNEDLITAAMTEIAGICMEEHSHEGHHDHEDHEGYDEHVWTSPVNAALIVEELCMVISGIDKEHAEEYRKNTEEYLEELQQLHEEYLRATKNPKRDLLIFADRFPFRYLTEEYDLRYAAAFEGCSSNTEPSLAVIAELMETARREQATTVFYIEFSDGKVAQMIADAAGAEAVMLHSCQNVTKEEFLEGETYVSLMRRNLKILEEALNG